MNMGHGIMPASVSDSTPQNETVVVKRGMSDINARRIAIEAFIRRFPDTLCNGKPF
jgi:hypothetical protein